jgi:predicted dehydrogenase
MRNTLVAGSGYWGRNLVRNMEQLGALYGICDTNPAVLAEFAKTYPQARLFADFDEALKDEGVQNVMLATPAETHFPLGLKALAAGKHVFAEKPLALNVDQGRALVEAAHAANRILFVGHLLEYHPAVTKLVELVRAGELGDLLYIYSNRLNLGKIRREENILWSFAPHDIAVILKLLREMPVSATCAGGSYIQPQIADTTVTLLDFASGTKAHIFVSWLHPFKEQKLVVVGSKKMAVFNDTLPENKLMVYNQGFDWVEGQPVPRKDDGAAVQLDKTEPLKAECHAFLDACATGTAPVTDGWNGLRVLRVLQASQESLTRHGQPVSISETYEALHG